jgi:hypothetical protein
MEGLEEPLKAKKRRESRQGKMNIQWKIFSSPETKLELALLYEQFADLDDYIYNLLCIVFHNFSGVCCHVNMLTTFCI